jgi:hypothetical protein
MQYLCVAAVCEQKEATAQQIAHLEHQLNEAMRGQAKAGMGTSSQSACRDDT